MRIDDVGSDIWQEALIGGTAEMARMAMLAMDGVPPPPLPLGVADAVRSSMARVKAEAHAEAEAKAGGNSTSELAEAGAGVGTEAAVEEAWAGTGAGARAAPEAQVLPAWGVSSSARTRGVVSARAAGARRPTGANSGTTSASARGARTRPATANDENNRTGPAAGAGAKSAAMLDYERAKAVASAPSSETFSLKQMPRRVASARGALAPLPTVAEGNARGARSRTRPATANDENKRTGPAAATGAPVKSAAMLDYERAKAGRCRLTVSKPVLKAPLVSALEATI